MTRCAGIGITSDYYFVEYFRDMGISATAITDISLGLISNGVPSHDNYPEDRYGDNPHRQDGLKNYSEQEDKLFAIPIDCPFIEWPPAEDINDDLKCDTAENTEHDDGAKPRSRSPACGKNSDENTRERGLNEPTYK